MSTVGLITLFLNIGSYASGAGGGVPWVAVLVLLAAPSIGGLIQMALSRAREFDADLSAAMLTGDPDGLAAALGKLERAQGRLWETIFLPGGRTPDPSVLRTHPLTRDRIERLLSLKSAVAERPATAPAVERRASLVPRIRSTTPFGGFGSPLFAVDDPDMGEGPAVDRSLNPPRANPRFHRSALWW